MFSDLIIGFDGRGPALLLPGRRHHRTLNHQLGRPGRTLVSYCA